jgi:oligoendopeptidase F
MKTREEIPSKDKWNVEFFYSSLEEWYAALHAFIPYSNTPYWPEIQSLQGTLQQGPTQIKKALDLLFTIERNLSKLYTYAHLRHDENITDPVHKKAYEEILQFLQIFSEETAWFQPELLSLSSTMLDEILISPLLIEYQFYLERIIRLKPHTLSSENEKLVALAGQAFQTSHKAFSAINDADFKFGKVVDPKGKEQPLSHGTYGIYIRDQDRPFREQVFKQYYQNYASYENTLCEILNGQIQNHVFQTKARHYSSCLEASLFPKNVDTSVYHSLIQAVHSRIDVLHRYMQLRKNILEVDELHLYDLHVPLTRTIDIQMSYEEAENLVIESVKPLGAEYQETLRLGLQKNGWVDRFENQNKRSGAYSSGCYDSMPYILMNYKNLLRDVFTLAHEAGHSMHSLYSHRYQPYHYSNYSIFVAEVASTFNEDLLIRLLIERCKTPEEKIFLLNQKIEDIRNTLFRQTMFAEFELFLHQQVENGIPLTPLLLKQEYRRLNEYYFGPSVYIDAQIEVEWARIPHFYYNFYVFQYATGISAALALSEKVINGTTKDRDAYLTFLKSGSSEYPIDTLKQAGIDMTSAKPVQSAIYTFDSLLSELEKIYQ